MQSKLLLGPLPVCQSPLSVNTNIFYVSIHNTAVTVNSQKKLKPFVANCVQEITEEFPATTLRYAPTSDNPADLLTRGISAVSLANSTIWGHDPPWLTNHLQWPVGIVLKWSPTGSKHRR